MKILAPIALSIALSLVATLIALVTSRLITRAAFRAQPPDEGRGRGAGSGDLTRRRPNRRGEGSAGPTIKEAANWTPQSLVGS